MKRHHQQCAIRREGHAQPEAQIIQTTLANEEHPASDCRPTSRHSPSNSPELSMRRGYDEKKMWARRQRRRRKIAWAMETPFKLNVWTDRCLVGLHWQFFLA